MKTVAAPVVVKKSSLHGVSFIPRPLLVHHARINLASLLPCRTFGTSIKNGYSPTRLYDRHTNFFQNPCGGCRKIV
jgi:hypothetical protein